MDKDKELELDKDGCMTQWIDGLMGGLLDVWGSLNGRFDWWMGGWTDWRVDRWIDKIGWMVGLINMDELLNGMVIRGNSFTILS